MGILLLTAWLSPQAVRAAEYFYASGTGAGSLVGARGRVAEVVVILDDDGDLIRQSLKLHVASQTMTFNMNAKSSVVRYDQNLAVLPGAAVPLGLTDRCDPHRDTAVGTILITPDGGQTVIEHFFWQFTCQPGNRGDCVTVAGTLATASYFIENPALRPVIDRIYMSTGCN